MDTDDATTTWIDAFAEPEDPPLHAARTVGDDLDVAPAGRRTGSWLRWLAGLRPARDVVEVGGGVGYSAQWLLAGMHPRGMLTSIEVEPDRQRHAQRLLGQAGHSQRVRCILGPALTVLPRLADEAYDLMFLDADPVEYQSYLAHARRMLRPGGLLLAARAGRAGSGDPTDTGASGLRAFLTALREDPTMDGQTLPDGDGLLLARKVAAV